MPRMSAHPMSSSAFDDTLERCRQPDGSIRIEAFQAPSYKELDYERAPMYLSMRLLARDLNIAAANVPKAFKPTMGLKLRDIAAELLGLFLDIVLLDQVERLQELRIAAHRALAQMRIASELQLVATGRYISIVDRLMQVAEWGPKDIGMSVPM